MSKQIALTVGDADITFVPTETDYNDYMNALAQGEIVNSAHNFLMNTVTEESKEVFRELTNENPGAAIQVVGEVLKEYTPKLQIKVKK
ncbi:putative phage tail assembly chaperone [Vibrio sp. 704]|uniref:putative phage tail assembly chaperone n=1 Tax=Vibrio sp. 704 TaxID=3074610 RepID=UPI002964D343|nr:putative phage tail assembly chaperone [Vibrio sp. 704]MDW2015176.1 putative phage tail assembly chaperone [Vibrio sp. 704]